MHHKIQLIDNSVCNIMNADKCNIRIAFSAFEDSMCLPRRTQFCFYSNKQKGQPQEVGSKTVTINRCSGAVRRVSIPPYFSTDRLTLVKPIP